MPCDDQDLAVPFGPDCKVYEGRGHGGGTVGPTISTPSYGGTWTNYGSTTGDENPVVITLDKPARYVGFWWSFGNSTNYVKFYRDNLLILEVSTEDIMDILGSAPTSTAEWLSRLDDDVSEVKKRNTDEVATYRAIEYFGNPSGYAFDDDSGVQGVEPKANTTNQPLLYLHLFAEGAVSFDKIELSGGGCEFDNLVISFDIQEPDPRLVFVSSEEGNPAVSYPYTVTFDANSSEAEGVVPPLTASTPTALTTSAFTRPGHRFVDWNTQADGQGTRFADNGARATERGRWSSGDTCKNARVRSHRFSPCPHRTSHQLPVVGSRIGRRRRGGVLLRSSDTTVRSVARGVVEVCPPCFSPRATNNISTSATMTYRGGVFTDDGLVKNRRSGHDVA